MSTLPNLPAEAIFQTSQLTELDIYLFQQGSHFRLYEILGSHLGCIDGVRGCRFAVWAPNAAALSVIGDFNRWDAASNGLHLREDGSGIWEGFIADIAPVTPYKYRIFWEVPSLTASRVWELDSAWNDADWMARRGEKNRLNAPCTIYEVHLGSWRRVPEDGTRLFAAQSVAEYPRLSERIIAIRRPPGVYVAPGIGGHTGGELRHLRAGVRVEERDSDYFL